MKAILNFISFIFACSGYLYTGACDTITSLSISFDCADKTVQGTEDRIYLGRKSDIDSETTDLTNSLIHKTYTLGTGKILFKITGTNQSMGAQFESHQNEFGVDYNHTVDFMGFDLTGDGLAELEALCNQEDIVIWQVNKYKGTSGAAAIYVYGYEYGMKVTLKQNRNEKQAVIQLQATNNKDKGFYEPHPPATLWNTDYLTSIDILENLTVP